MDAAEKVPFFFVPMVAWVLETNPPSALAKAVSSESVVWNRRAPMVTSMVPTSSTRSELEVPLLPVLPGDDAEVVVPIEAPEDISSSGCRR